MGREWTMRGTEGGTLSLGKVRRDDLPRVGGKAANLGALVASGLPVPAGFVVTATAFDRFVAACPDHDHVFDLLSRTSTDPSSQIANLSREIQSCLAGLPVPVAVRKEVLAEWRALGTERRYAVRSSATVEDAPEQSFAGQFESVLNVHGSDALLEAVKRCWLSLYSERALAYMRGQSVSPLRAKMAVVVQEMVEAEWSGVVFTAEPLTGATDRIVLECVRGLGDVLVQGTVSPQRIVVEKASQRVLESEATERVLPPAWLPQLLDMADRCEALFGGPQDIEWAVGGNSLYLLQARPITGKSPAKTWEDRQIWSNLNTGEVLPDVATPITWSFLLYLFNPLFRKVFRMHGAKVGTRPIIGLVAGRVYFNANTGLAAVKPFSFLLNRISNLAQALGGGQFEVSRELLRSVPDEDLPDLGFSWPKFVLTWPRTIWELIRHSPGRGDAWLIRTRARNDELVRLNVERMSTSELLQCFKHILTESFAGWDLLYLGTQAVALLVFQKACHDWLGDPDLALGYRLFAGLGGVAEAEAGLALWRLAALAYADKATEATVLASESWPAAQAQLNETEAGRRFLKAWAAFMSEHGHRCRGELELFNARWSEQPEYILGIVRGYLGAMDLTNPVDKQRRLAEERQRLTNECRRRLRNPIKRGLFSRSLRRAQKLAVSREEWKNQAVRQMTVLRRVLLALGQRLHEQGILAQPDDIFFLEVSEIEPVTTGQTSFSAQERIAARRREYERNLTLTPPPVVVGRYRPSATPMEKPEASGGVLTGIPVSPGVATGRARVILRCDNHQQVLTGEILVAPFTDPAWTPYFVTAAAVVMDQGGILSHGSIVAREYGLPAVTNVGLATQTIQTGDLLEVDGNRGQVTVLQRSTAPHDAPLGPKDLR